MYDELVKRLRELPHLLFIQLHGHEDAVYEAADAIEDLSARDRKPEPDHWIVSASEDYAGGGYVKCGHCGYKFSWAGYFSADEWKFCPECGWPKEAPDESEE